MKTLVRVTSLLTVLSVLFFACQKEVSFEKGSSSSSVGSLAVDGTGNCLGAVVSGTYYKDTTLKATNYVDVTVTVDTVGTYTVSSDTVNGYYFKATGTFSATGSQTVRLAGAGKPLNSGTNIFTVTYNGTVCSFSVTVTAASGGSAAYTISCTSPTVNGTYKVGTALTSANTVTLSVNVTTIGSWSVSTAPAVNGMTFAGSGNFTTTGAQTITLTGSGTPTAAGSFNFPVSSGSSSCNFSVTVTSAIPDYYPRTTNSNWSYQFDGDPNDSLLIVATSLTKTVGANTYNVFIVTDDAALGFDTSGYYRRSGNDYFEWIDMGSFVGLDDPQWMEYNFLKDNLTAGGTWMTSQFSGAYTPQGGATITVTLRWEFTIVQQNATVTVNGQSYANTIQVKQELKQLVSGTWTQVAYFNCYYARDKGLIKQDLYDGTGTLVYALDVRRLVVY